MLIPPSAGAAPANESPGRSRRVRPWYSASPRSRTGTRRCPRAPLQAAPRLEHTLGRRCTAGLLAHWSWRPATLGGAWQLRPVVRRRRNFDRRHALRSGLRPALARSATTARLKIEQPRFSVIVNRLARPPRPRHQFGRHSSAPRSRTDRRAPWRRVAESQSRSARSPATA